MLWLGQLAGVRLHVLTWQPPDRGRKDVMEAPQPLVGLFRNAAELERRRAPRCEADADVCCTVREPNTGRWLLTAIRDISVSGIALLADQPFEPGQLLTIELRNDRSGWARKYLIEVCHADICYPNDDWLHGCRFAQPLGDEELRLWL